MPVLHTRHLDPLYGHYFPRSCRLQSRGISRRFDAFAALEWNPLKSPRPVWKVNCAASIMVVHYFKLFILIIILCIIIYLKPKKVSADQSVSAGHRQQKRRNVLKIGFHSLRPLKPQDSRTKIIFQIGTLNPHGITEPVSFNWFILLIFTLLGTNQ